MSCRSGAALSENSDVPEHGLEALEEGPHHVGEHILCVLQLSAEEVARVARDVGLRAIVTFSVSRVAVHDGHPHGRESARG